MIDARHMDKFLPNTNEPSVFVRVSTELDNQRTKLVQAKSSPQWSENLTLDINHGHEQIKVELIVQTDKNTKQTIGSCLVELESLKDQMNNDSVHDLF